MSQRLRQRIALLLVAVMALLPLQAVSAAWSLHSDAQHCAHGESSDKGDHQAQMQGHKGACCAGQAAATEGDDTAGSHQCNGSCDLCGGCTAAAFDQSHPKQSSLRDTPDQTEVVTATAERHSPLLRPPSALR